MDQGRQAASETGKGKEAGSSIAPLEKNVPC